MPKITYTQDFKQEDIDNFAFVLWYTEQIQDWEKSEEVTDENWNIVWTKKVPNMILNPQSTIDFCNEKGREVLMNWQKDSLLQEIKKGLEKENIFKEKQAEEAIQIPNIECVTL